MQTTSIKDFDLAFKMLSFDEGYKAFPYNDKTGKSVESDDGRITIGIGHNLEDNGVSHAVIRLMFEEDFATAYHSAQLFFTNFNNFSQNRRLAIVNMIFNLGTNGFHQFRNMRSHIEKEEWQQAAEEAQKSAWYFQVGKRAKRVITMLHYDIWPKEYEGL